MSDPETAPAAPPPPQFTAYVGKVEVSLKDRNYAAYISPPPASASLEELETILKANRQAIQTAQADLKKAYLASITAPKDKPIPLNLAAATQNALVAHLTINVIIPLINMRNGGHADYSADETLPVQTRLEKMRATAEKQIADELKAELDKIPKPKPPPNPIPKATLIVSGIVIFFWLVLG